MATIRAYTTIEQSRKLAEFLPLESADGFYEVQINPFTNKWEDILFVGNEWANDEVVIPAWSLAALLGVLPNENMLVKTTDGEYYCLAKDVMTKHYDNPVDACVAMIVKLYELNML